jgi:hypothetical protein
MHAALSTKLAAGTGVVKAANDAHNVSAWRRKRRSQNWPR